VVPATVLMVVVFSIWCFGCCCVGLVLWIFWFSDYFQICWDLQKSLYLVDLYCAGGDWFSSGDVNLCLMELLLNFDGPVNFASRSEVRI
jgi:hypothetical protein